MTNSSDSNSNLHEQLNDQSQSAFARYQNLALGTNSLWYLIKYELVMLLCSWIPGALGLVLRKFLYPTILGSVGRNVIFGKGVMIRHGLKITVSDNVIIDDEAVLDAKGGTNSGIYIGENTIVSRGVVLSCKDDNITVGANCTVGINTIVHGMQGSPVIIGDYVLIGAFCYFIGGGPYVTDDLDLPFKKQGTLPQGGINVANNVWFGSNVQILDGTSIGTGSIVGASTVVNKDVQAFDVVAGAPMKVIKSRKAQTK